MAVGVECLWPADPTGGVPVRVQDDFGVYKVPGRDSLVQSLAKSRGSRHVWRFVGRMSFIVSRIYTAQKTRLFQPKLPKRADDGGKLYDLGRSSM